MLESVRTETPVSMIPPVPDINVAVQNDDKASSVSPHGYTSSKQHTYPLPFGVISKLNRSTEILATLPRVKADIQRHHSLRFQHRTLPPLPTCQMMSPTGKEPCENLALSQPHLEETDTTSNSSTLERSLRKLRRLSSSMDCLTGSDVLSPSAGEPCLSHPFASPPPVNLDVEPYLHPVEIKQIMDSPVRKSVPMTGSASLCVRRTKNRPSLPSGMMALSSSSQSINGPKEFKDKAMGGGSFLLRDQLMQPGSCT